MQQQKKHKQTKKRKMNKPPKQGEKVIIQTVKPFSKRGAYVYVPSLWMGKRAERLR